MTEQEEKALFGLLKFLLEELRDTERKVHALKIAMEMSLDNAHATLARIDKIETTGRELDPIEQKFREVDAHLLFQKFDDKTWGKA
jgi:hypothetical protein